MRYRIALAFVAPALLAACSDGSVEQTQERMSTVDVQEASSEYAMAPVAPPPPPPLREAPVEAGDGGDTEAVAPSLGQIPVGLPQIAYRYAIGFRLPADAIRPLQQRHADLCEARGANTCRIVSMDQAEDSGDYASATLHLAVASRVARDFTKELEKTSGSVDAELVSSSIQGEDLSKQIVDTEARLRARTVLRDRLMEVLRNRRGTVAELVEAERGVAQVNEEIDQARGWLAEMRGRVAFSQITIAYQSGSPSAGGFTDPIRSAWSSLGSILGSMIAFAMLALTVLIPLGLLVYAGVRVSRWVQQRGGADGTGYPATSAKDGEPRSE